MSTKNQSFSVSETNGIAPTLEILNPEVDWASLKRVLATATSSQAKIEILEFVVEALHDVIPQEELALFGSDRSLRAFLLSPGFREELRFRADPARLAALQAIDTSTAVPAEQAMRELGEKLGK